MSGNLDSFLAEAMTSIGDQLERQHGINKAFFMVINELLKNNATSNMIVRSLLTEAEGRIQSEKLDELKRISEKYLTRDVARHQAMTTVMLDAMQGNKDDLEKKLNELFRKTES